MGIGLTILKYTVFYEVGLSIRAAFERHKYWNESREYCNEVGKQLLRIGVRRSPLEPPNGDVTLDIDPVILTIPGGVLGDERDMSMWKNREFGVCFNEHTLEHLYSAEDVELAVNECVRVADIAVFLAPSPYSLWSNFLVPTHKLRIWFDNVNERIKVEPNKYNTGLGITNPPAIRQAFVSKGKAPIITKEGRVIVVESTY